VPRFVVQLQETHRASSTQARPRKYAGLLFIVRGLLSDSVASTRSRAAPCMQNRAEIARG